MRKRIIIIIAATGIFFACKHQVNTPVVNPVINPGNGGGGGSGSGDDTLVCFEGAVLPIFISNCAKSGCHDAASHQDGYVLDSWENITREGIEPGDPGESEIYEVMVETDKDKRMPAPPNAPLSKEQTDLVKRWITEGAKNTTNCSGCDTTIYNYAGAVAPIMSLNCVGCHNSSNANGGVNLSVYSGVQQVASDGRLIGVITWAPGYKQMPQGGNQLDDCNITQITRWVNDGAKNN